MGNNIAMNLCCHARALARIFIAVLMRRPALGMI
jgi:hypothetical protein